MGKWLLFLFCFFKVTSLLGQEHDNIWYLGYSGEVDDPLDTLYGITVLDFSGNEIYKYQEDYSFIDFDALNVAMSDSLGSFSFAFNGYKIEDASLNAMENGDYFNAETYDPGGGYRLPQGGLALPFPEHPGQYILFHSTKATIEEPNWGPKIIKLFYSVIDMDENNGLGAVVQKNEMIINDTLGYGLLTACKHANGRDWWILANKYKSNEMYQLLLDENGVQLYNIQVLQDTLSSGLGQAVFSPDGSKYTVYSAVSFVNGEFVEIFNFDRCSGLLSNHIQINFDDNAFSTGAAISPNSRYLYAPSDLYIYQYDLWADDIASTKDTVAIYDGFGDPFATRFFLAQLAPDGKIYISANNSTNYLTVIHKPNNPGVACNVEQHGLRLPTRNFTSIPNNPYYRLGPLDGSPCDTLGLD
ncbi:MAG: hypothetical protein DWQ02_20170, partial [Bacteroidetes bacterium]